MHISDVNASTHRSEHLKNTGVGNTQPVSPGQSAAEDQPEAKSDRVEISDNARSANRSSDDVAYARNALHSVPELSDARTAQITERIKSGYYNNPEVLQKISERLGNELLGG